ncbi:GroES-like protein [Dendrothele bispora CBS 962.96]|uniref:alcohol dehydrogenase n=1 Tax=Dendrothele bispora (strain CBS 962.96) TaxID=1314807 RepID=A0A4S8LUN2_DENBC|nr:GroES-like protein [Dendrothele bispora CBS 962.96]
MAKPSYDIPPTGRAAVITEYKKDLALAENHPVPSVADLNPGECLVKIEYAGVCQSDLHVKDDAYGFNAPLPLIGGHEGIGRIVAIAEHTVGSPVKVGDRVGLKWTARSCLKCENCRKGMEACCAMVVTHAHGCTVNGTWTEYAVAWTDYVTPIPEGLDSAAATPILCAGVTTYKAVKQSNAKIGDWIAISGAGGGLGHLAVQYAVAMGLRVIAIDTGASKRDLCVNQLGAEKWVDFMESKDLVKDVIEAAGGLGPHAAVIAAGSPIPFNQALLYLRPAGTLVAVGMPAGGAMLNVPIALLVPRCINIVGSATGNRQDMAEALDIVAQGKVKCHYEVRDWEEVNDVLKDLRAGTVTGRVVLRIADPRRPN